MSAYKKTKHGLEFIIYDAPVLKEASGIIPDYPCGGAILYRMSAKENFVEILAHVKYRPGFDAEDYTHEISHYKAIQALGAYDIEALPPIDDFVYSESPILVTSKFELLTDALPYITQISQIFLKLKNVTPTELLALTKEDEEEELSCLLGYTTKKAFISHKLQLSEVKAIPFPAFFSVADDDLSFGETDPQDSNIFLAALLAVPPVNPIIREIQGWISKNPYPDFLKTISNRVKGQEEIKFITANVYHYLHCLANGKPHNSNVLLAAPSGCGKTETFRALKQYFKAEIPLLPVIQFDMTSMTEEGFRGANTDSLVAGLFEAETGGIGIIFMDEFDKKLLPSYTSSGNNVNAAVQAQLLTLIEGREVVSSGRAPKKINTANTMFFGLGSFDSCRSIKAEEATHRPIGFSETPTTEYNHYDRITREDMISIGASYELLGRFVSVVNFHPLSTDAVDEIIDQMLDNISESFGCKVTITADMRDELHIGSNGSYGCRRFLSILNDLTMHQYAEMLANGEPIEDCTIVLDADEKTRHFRISSEVA